MEKTRPITAWFSEEEITQLEKAAAKDRRSRSAFMAKCSLDRASEVLNES